MARLTWDKSQIWSGFGKAVFWRPSLQFVQTARRFLSHDSTKCGQHCKTCAYWVSVWPDFDQRVQKLNEARLSILEFRACYPKSIEWGDKAKMVLREELDKIYRECQTFATDRIKEAVEMLFQAQR